MAVLSALFGSFLFVAAPSTAFANRFRSRGVGESSGGGVDGQGTSPGGASSASAANTTRAEVELLRTNTTRAGVDEPTRTATPRTTSAIHAEPGSGLHNSSIPPIVSFMGPWDPNDIVERNRKFVPKGTKFLYYDYSQVDESVKRISALLKKSEGFSGSWDAYRNLRPYSYRSDLWRYMILWDHGGIYMDAKLLFAAPISEWVDREHDELAMCQDAWRCGHEQIYQSTIVAARPRHRSTLAVIKKIVSNIQKHYYGGRVCPDRNDLMITGPGALTQALTEAGVKPSVRCKMKLQRDYISGREVDPRLVKLHDDRATLMGWDVQEHAKMRACTNCNAYGELFGSRAIYCDQTYRGLHQDPCKEHDSGTPFRRYHREGYLQVRAKFEEELIRGEWTRNEHYWSKIV